MGAPSRSAGSTDAGAVPLAIGRKRTLILFAVCSFLTVIAYMYMPVSNGVMLLLGFPLGFCASGSFSPIGSFFTELFPSRVRGSGQGFSYNVGRDVGALFPTLVGFLSTTMSLGHAIAIFAMLHTWFSFSRLCYCRRRVAESCAYLND